jgi:hypothetical protein
LLVTDGLSSYNKSQALKIFTEPIRTAKVGRPKLMLAAGVMVARLIKRYPGVRGWWKWCGRLFREHRLV